MKVLFLDVDGVLNKHNTTERISTVLGEFTATDPKLVKRLKDWLNNHPDVTVVLSSSWRLDERFDYAFTNHLKEIGLSWHYDVTPNTGRRGNDIHAWLCNHPEVTQYAILDDDTDMYPVGKNWAQTSEVHGLEDKHLHKLNELIG